MEPRPTGRNCVRRTLFGPVDPSQLQRDLEGMLHASMEKAKQKWNFDFWQEMPEEGLLQWEEVQDHKVPAFYRTCVVGDGRKPLQPVNRLVAKDSQTHPTVQRVEKARPTMKMEREKRQARKKRRQMPLTDYYTTKKQVRMEMQTPEKKMAF